MTQAINKNKKAEKLDNFRYLTFDCKLKNTIAANRLFSFVKSMIIEHKASCIPSKETHKTHFDECLSIILTNLFTAYKADDKLYTAVSLDKNYYTSKFLLSYISYTFINSILNALCSKELNVIELVKGINSKNAEERKRTRIKANKDLISKFDEFGLTILDITINSDIETIVIKDKAKTRIDYKDNDLTRSMRNNVQSINSLLNASYIDLALDDNKMLQLRKDISKSNDNDDQFISKSNDNDDRFIDLTKKMLIRIFNNCTKQRKTEQGGRFYSTWWQQIPNKDEKGKYRQYIIIDGEQTVELDYSTMQPRILYSKLDLDLPKVDFYTIEDYEREDVKKTFNAMLNAQSKDDFILNCSKNNKYKKKNLILIEMIERTYPELKHFFYSGEGLKSMLIDSAIAERIMLLLHAKNIVVLPIHDSFIVQKKYESELREAMEIAFNDKISNVECKIKKETITDENLKTDDAFKSYIKSLKGSEFGKRYKNWNNKI